MKNTTVDVYVYLVSMSNPALISGLINKVSQLAGVVKANINPKIKSVLAVEYDPKHISGSTILKFINQNGHNGALIGL